MAFSKVLEQEFQASLRVRKAVTTLVPGLPERRTLTNLAETARSATSGSSCGSGKYPLAQSRCVQSNSEDCSLPYILIAFDIFSDVVKQSSLGLEYYGVSSTLILRCQRDLP